jgi:hypothetical protein
MVKVWDLEGLEAGAAVVDVILSASLLLKDLVLTGVVWSVEISEDMLNDVDERGDELDFPLLQLCGRFRGDK